MTYDAVLLDSDGVLVEPPGRSTFVEAARSALDRTGVRADPTTVARDLVDGYLDRVATRCRESDVSLASFCQQAATTAFAAQRREFEETTRRTYDDVRALWGLDVPLGVVSDNQPQFVEYVLRRLGLDSLVETVRCRSLTPETLEHRKPDPANLAAAVDDLDAETAVYVGDTAVDVGAAANLGIDSVLLERDGPTDVTPTPDYRIESLTELAAVLG